jgi:putative ABC transport system permease protein
VIGYELWEKRFNAGPGVVGSTVILNGAPFTVVGVAPAGFVGTDIEEPAEVWVPAMMQAVVMPRLYPVLGDRKSPQFRLIGRVRKGISSTRAGAALALAAQQLNAGHPDRRWPLRLSVSPLTSWVAPVRIGGILPVVALAAIITGLVLLITCANLANLLLARAAARRREIAIRQAMGAGRLRLVRQLLTESVLLSLLGGGLGLLTALWTADAFHTRFRGPTAPLDLSLDWRTLAFALALLTAAAFGLMPAWHASRPELVPALKHDAAGMRFRRSRLQGSLVVAQVALSLVLLLTVGLFLRAIAATARADLGYDTENVLVLSTETETVGYIGPSREAFEQELRARVEQLPGVEAASFASAAPLGRGFALFGIRLPDEAATPGAEGPLPGSMATVAAGVEPDYFRVLGIPLLRGRSFTEADAPGAPQVAVVNEAFARRAWPGEDPIGQRFALSGTEE